MKRVGHLLFAGVMATGPASAWAQNATPGMERLLHNGWDFAAADAEARIAWDAGAALMVGCQAGAPGVTLLLRNRSVIDQALSACAKGP